MMNPLINSMHHPHPMIYHNPHMAAAMMTHPMIHPMMFQPPPLPPQPSSSSSINTNNNSNQPPLPPPLMSQPIPKPLMGFNATPTGSVAASSSSSLPPPPTLPHLLSTQHTIKPLFPANDEINATNNTNRLTPPNNQPNKIESLAPGSKIVHPEDDISLVRHFFYHYNCSGINFIKDLLTAQNNLVNLYLRFKSKLSYLKFNYRKNFVQVITNINTFHLSILRLLCLILWLEHTHNKTTLVINIIKTSRSNHLTTMVVIEHTKR
jgi:hypothetical protein